MARFNFCIAVIQDKNLHLVKLNICLIEQLIWYEELCNTRRIFESTGNRICHQIDFS